MDLRKGDLSPVLVRRIKDDIRAIEGGFPERKPEQVDIQGLPDNAPELVLSQRFDAYREMREACLAGESASKRSQARLVLINLQKRLLSSIEAFWRTIRVHRDAMRRAAAGEVTSRVPTDLGRLLSPIGADDDRAASADSEALVEQVEAALDTATRGTVTGDENTSTLSAELQALDELVTLADRCRDIDDARIIKSASGLIRTNAPAFSPRRRAPNGIAGVSLSSLNGRIHDDISRDVSRRQSRRLIVPMSASPFTRALLLRSSATL